MPQYHIAVKAAQEAAEILKQMRKEGFKTNFKGARDLVTSADIAAEGVIIDTIRSAFPDHTILSEESSPNKHPEVLGAEHLWIIDPIDGTTNFAHGIHQVGISIAYVSRGAIQVGVVHAPFLSEVFAAERGRGSTLNGAPIRAHDPETVESALVATGFPYDRSNLGPIQRRFERILPRCRDLRRMGAASLDLCFTACGRLNAYYETCEVWDIAAGALIAREAGCLVSPFTPLPEPWSQYQELYPVDLLAAGPKLHGLIRELFDS
jgi:myo-inositol-1(or 4)-monophosphatase